MDTRERLDEAFLKAVNSVVVMSQTYTPRVRQRGAVSSNALVVRAKLDMLNRANYTPTRWLVFF